MATTASCFAQVVSLVNRRSFAEAVERHDAEEAAKGFTCWDQFVAMLFCQVGAANSLREICGGLATAMDRGYNDYQLFAAWTDAGVFFVTRARANMVYEVVEERDVPERGNVLSDETIRLTGARAEEKCPHLLRRIVVWDEANERELVLLTNLFHLAASTVAAIYKERWQIELFFKALKQHLKVKTFVGTSENAVKTQIWVALIAILLLKYLQLRSSWAWSLSNLAAMLRFNLLTYRDLWAWLDAPFAVPLLEPQTRQLPLFAPGLLDSIRGQPPLRA